MHDAQPARRHWAAKITKEIADAMRADRAAGMPVFAIWEKWHETTGLSFYGVRAVLYHACWKNP